MSIRMHIRIFQLLEVLQSLCFEVKILYTTRHIMKNCDFHVELCDGMCTELTFDGEFVDHFVHSDLFILKIDEVMFYSSSTS
jgi:hypothetical protein